MAEPILRAEGLTALDGGAIDLASVSFSLAPATLAAVVGPDGWDKDALVAVITGSRAPRAGTLRFAGRPITRLAGAARARRGLAWTARPPAVFATGTVGEAVALALAARRPVRPLEPFRRRPAPASARAAGEILAFVGLEAAAERAPSDLAPAERARLELARALALDPRVVVVDRPTADLEPADARAVAALLARLARQGPAVLWVADDAGLALAHADQIVALHHGRTLTAGALGAPPRADALEAAFLGTVR
jgi:branched-chain amino acid transport system ATP-binding protein